MKTNKLLSIILLTALFTGACKQTLVEFAAPAVVTPVAPSKGSADFSKFVSLGESFIAGTQGGTIFDGSQNNSLPKLLATQFASVGGGAFNQPLVNHPNGLNFIVFAGSGGAVQLGRYVLFDADGDVDPDAGGCGTSRTAAPRAAGNPAAAAVCPSTATTPAMPAPYNTFQTVTELISYTGDRAILNNFGVPGTKVFHALTPLYAAGSPWYARIASNPGVSTLLGDASNKSHKFFLLSLGLQDILGYASTGAQGNPNGGGSADMTPEAGAPGTGFTATYNLVLNTMLTDPAAKGVVTTIPDITTLPLFYTVTYNNIEFKSTNCNDAALIGGLGSIFGGYNGALDLILAGGIGGLVPGLTADEIARRKVSFTYGKNPILINDETLTNIGTQLGIASPLFAQYGQMRPATASDMILLNAGSILGVCAAAPGPGNPVTPAPAGWPAALPWLYGVGAPLTDGFVLLPTEQTEIKDRTVLFNTQIKAAATASAGRVAVADIYEAYKTLVTNKFALVNGVTITPTFAPPTGIFSEDGVHPNGRGYAFTANIIINAINAQFGATIPNLNVAAYAGTSLPAKGQ